MSVDEKLEALETVDRPSAAMPDKSFHIAVLIVCGALLIATIDPLGGAGLLILLIGGVLLFALGCAWSVLLLVWLFRSKDRISRASMGWLIAPAIVIGTFTLMVSAPAAQWALSKGDFESFVAKTEPAGDFEQWHPIDAPDWIGAYRVQRVSQVDEIVVFYFDSIGFDDTGIVYFPDGPDERLSNGGFERPIYRALGGPWYRFSASW